MGTSEGYGQRLAERLRAEQTHAIVTRVLRTADMAVTETRCDNPVLGLSHSIQREDAYLVALTLRDFPNRQYWEDGRQMPVCDMRTGQVDFHDLKRDPVALLDKPYHDLFFYLPRSALGAIADDADAPRIGDLNHQPVAIDDTTISSLGRAILPALSHPDQVNLLFIDHVLLALGVHVAQTYGGMRPLSRPVRGGLAPWQVRRAEEILSANLDGRVPLKEVARECGLSVSHFSRAFRRTTGAAPHHWLMTRRVEAAKEKLRDGRLSLLEVALACGFSDQTHLTRVFTGMVGVGPGAWRRALDQYVPTPVIQRTQDTVVNIEGGWQLPKSIPNARFLELSGTNHLPFLGNDIDQTTDDIAEFLTDVKPAMGGERTLATVLFTDIVESTKRAETIGDRRWRELLDAHNSIFRRELARFRGVEVKTLGDGFLATFDGPGRAIRCSLGVIAAVRSLNIEIRAGLHTGEVEVGGRDVRGIGVHIAARVAALAQPSECLVTRIVKDLVAGADIGFTERGKRDLKGLTEGIDLFAVTPDALSLLENARPSFRPGGSPRRRVA